MYESAFVIVTKPHGVQRLTFCSHVQVCRAAVALLALAVLGSGNPERENDDSSSSQTVPRDPRVFSRSFSLQSGQAAKRGK